MEPCLKKIVQESMPKIKALQLFANLRKEGRKPKKGSLCVPRFSGSWQVQL